MGRIYTLVIIALLLLSRQAYCIDKIAYFHVLETEALDLVQSQIDLLNRESQSSIVKAYTAGLLIKQSGLEADPGTKLKLFKQGVALLEEQIAEYPANAEYKFIRYIMQDRSPVFLRYKSNLEEDAFVVGKDFSKLDKPVQDAVRRYAVNSPLLSNYLPK